MKPFITSGFGGITGMAGYQATQISLYMYIYTYIHTYTHIKIWKPKFQLSCGDFLRGSLYGEKTLAVKPMPRFTPLTPL
jgi:hypothetical protein